ncbi:MAG: hypothetical protein ACRD8U_10615 [Pyrinomonadaceae bacterium]
MKYRLLLAVVLSALSFMDVLGQGDVDLDSLDHKIKQHLQSNILGWTHRRGQPITGSGNVLIEKWSSPNRGIKISIVPYKSAARAQEVIRHFLEFDKDVQEVKEIGNEAYAWGWEGTNLVFRKGKYLVYLSAGYDADSDPDLRMLEPNEKRRRQIQEIRRINKEFAKHVATAVD